MAILKHLTFGNRLNIRHHIVVDHEIRHVPVLKGGIPIDIVTLKDALGKDLVEFEEDEYDRENTGHCQVNNAGI